MPDLGQDQLTVDGDSEVRRPLSRSRRSTRRPANNSPYYGWGLGEAADDTGHGSPPRQFAPPSSRNSDAAWGDRGYGRAVSFNSFARKVRDTSLPFGLRVSALASCVQLYRPIGHRATLHWLLTAAGPYQRDEAALMRALEILIASRRVRQAELAVYAEQRRAAKALGHRCPTKTEPHPDQFGYWFGAPREAALHALELWRSQSKPRPGRVGYRDALTDRVDAAVAECLRAGGSPSPKWLAEVSACADAVHSARHRPGLYADDQQTYFHYLKLAGIARLLAVACGGR